MPTAAGPTRNYTRARSSIKAAQAWEKDMPSDTYVLEGRIWKELGNSPRAELAYLIPWRRGAKDVEDTLKAIYLKRNGSEAGFDAYLSKGDGPAGTSKGRRMAPVFKVASLDDRSFDLEALCGKVVVLNFWFEGCAPCNVEMPRLNQLASEFKDKDVVFVAFALDKAESLKEFLKKKPFNYQFIPDASKMSELYNVNGYPTHIVISKDGEINARVGGGSESQLADLRTLIERGLKSAITNQ